MTLPLPAWELILALADDEMFMGHRHSEWLGVSPYLEEDLAFASIAQDELGHARALYGLLVDDVDALAYGRAPGEYRSCWLAELPGRPWEDALVRHVLYDTAERLRWEALAGSSMSGLDEIAAKAIREEKYHRRHAISVLDRMLQGTNDSRDQVEAAFGRVFPYAGGLFEPTAGEDEAVAAGVVARPAAEIAVVWQDEVTTLFSGGDADVDWSMAAGEGGRAGIRSEYFSEAFGMMTEVLATDPSARW